MTKLVSGLIMSVLVTNGYWPVEKSQPIIDKTQTIRLAPDTAKLSEGERKAVAKLIEVGQIFQKLYELQRHPEALTAYRALEQLNKQNNGAPATQNLVTLYRLFQGPIATTLENKREPFLPVDALKPGKNMYPWGVTKEDIEAFIQISGNPEKTRAELLDLRTVVRLANAKNTGEDILKLNKYPVLQTLHPQLMAELQRVAKGLRDREGKPYFYAIP
jgi:type I site-specific restriction endonuclease